MSNPVCSTATLVTQAAPFVVPPITEEQRKCLMIYAKVLELKALGGTDYTGDWATATTLLKDAAALEIGMSQNERDAARVNLAFVNAAAAGATVPATLNAKLAVLGLLVNADPDLLDQADLLLTCKLGVHKGYPQ